MLTILAFLLVSQAEKPISVGEFKAEYLKHYRAARKAHENVTILESVRFFHEPQDKTKWIEGRICGDYFSLAGNIGEEFKPADRILLTPKSVLSVRLNPENDKWVLQRYSPIPDNATFVAERNSIWGQFPQSFRWYFRSPIAWGLTVEEVLDGRSKQSPTSSVKVDKLQAVTSGKHPAYRLSYTIVTPDQASGRTGETKGYFDVVPELNWAVIGGFLVHHWDNEFGERINGVPVLKRGVMSRRHFDEKTGQFSKIPMYEIVVHKAEPYSTVDEEEYKPEHYGLPATLPTLIDLNAPPSNETPFVLYLALFGVICFIAGILILARAQRRARLAAKAAAAPPPA